MTTKRCLACRRLLSILSIVASSCLVVRADNPEPEISVNARIYRPELPDRIFVDLTQSDCSIRIPPNALFQFELFIADDSDGFVALPYFVTDQKSLRQVVHADQNQLPLEASMQTQARGKWYRRRFEIAALAGANVREAYLALMWDGRGQPKKLAHQTVRFRNIQIVDGKGQVVADFTPRTGTIPFPLLSSDRYGAEIQVAAARTVSGSFQPAKYLSPTELPVTGSLLLRNFDASSPADVTYSVRLSGLDGVLDASNVSAESGTKHLAPGETATIPIDCGKRRSGSYRPIVQLSAAFPGDEKGPQVAREIPGFAITVAAEASLNTRPPPFSPGGFAMGEVVHLGTALQCIPAVREIGANYFQLRIMWSQVETEPGKYDFHRIDPYLDLIRSCGMKCELDFYAGYPADSVPQWYQSEQMLTNQQRPLGGPFRSVPYWSEARQAGLRGLAAMCRQYKGDPAIVSWNAYLGGESDAFYGLKHRLDSTRELMDYTESSQQAFEAYVRDQLKFDLAQARRRYEARLDSWQALRQPDPIVGQVDLRPLWKDFMDYRLWSVDQAEQQASAAIESVAPTARSEYMYGGSLDYVRTGNDYDIGVANAQLHHGSIHHTASPSPANQAYLSTAWRDRGVPFTIETTGTPAEVPEHQYAFYELLRDNAAGFTWIQSDSVLKRPPPDRAFGEYRAVLERMNGAVPLTTPPLVLYSYSSQLIDALENGPTAAQQLAAKNFVQKLELANYDFDLVTDRTLQVKWSRYPLVIDSDSTALTDRATAELIQYVHNGGKLVLFAGSGEFDPDDGASRFKLLRALGATIGEQRPELSPTSARFATDGGGEAVVSLSLGRRIQALPADAEVLASDQNHSPAVARWHVGHGGVLLWAGIPEMSVADSHDPRLPTLTIHAIDGTSTVFPSAFDRVLCDFSSVKPPAQPLSSDTLTCIRRVNDDLFIIAFNPTAQAHPANISFRAEPSKVKAAFDWIDNLSIPLPRASSTAGNMELPLTLLPYDVKVVELSNAPIIVAAPDFPRRVRRQPTTNPNSK